MKKFAVLAVAVCMSLAFATTVFATAELGKKESKPCSACHVKPVKGDENLNAVGKCYKEKKDLAACEKK